MFARAPRASSLAESQPAASSSAESASTKRPPSWSLRNWPVRWKVVAIVAVPLVLAMVFGDFALRMQLSDAHRLRLAADRAEMVPAITKYMSALDVALLASSTGGEVDGAKKNYEARKSELESRLQRNRRRARRERRRRGDAGRRAVAAGQRRLEHPGSAAPGDDLRAHPVDRRERDRRLGARRQRADPRRGARAQPGDRGPRPDDDAAGADRPRCRSSRARAADVDDDLGRYRAVDPVRDGRSARRRLARGQDAAAADGDPDGPDVGSGAKAGQQSCAAALGADHRRDRLPRSSRTSPRR